MGGLSAAHADIEYIAKMIALVTEIMIDLQDIQ